MSEYQTPAPSGGAPQGGYYPLPNGAPYGNQPIAPQPPLSAMAITGLVLGIIALVSSPLPIINNASFFIALLGGVFAIVGLTAVARLKRSGKALATAGLVLNIVAVVVVLATQSMYSAALDEAFSGSEVVSSSASESTRDAPEESARAADKKREREERSDRTRPEQDFSNLSIGTTVELASGLSITVLEVQTGLSDYDGSPLTGVVVSYENGGSKEASFDMFDWKAEDAQGAQRSSTFYLDSENDLSSGSLAPGGQVSGSLYFEGDIAKVLYYSSFFSDSTATWTIA